MKQRIVIIGGGLAGVACARSLQRDKRLDITLITTQPHLCYRPALMRSHAGLSDSEVRMALSDIFDKKSNIAIVHEPALAIDHLKKTVKTSGHKIPYDELVMAVGLEATAPSGDLAVQQPADVAQLKAQIHKLLTGSGTDRRILVVGGGARGVSLAADIAQLAAAIKLRHKLTGATSVAIIEAAPRILQTLPESLSRRVTRRLVDLGVAVHTSITVQRSVASKRNLPEDVSSASLRVWSIRAELPPIVQKHQTVFKINDVGRIVVDSFMRADANIWAIGDCAGTEYSGYAQTAVSDGKYLAHNLKKHLSQQKMSSYKATRPWTFLDVGRHWCAAHIKGRELYGRTGWVARRTEDFKFYRSIMPNRMALRAWNRGSTIPSDCPHCAGN